MSKIGESYTLQYCMHVSSVREQSAHATWQAPLTFTLWSTIMHHSCSCRNGDWFRMKLNPFFERNSATCCSRVGGLEESHISAPDGLVFIASTWQAPLTFTLWRSSARSRCRNDDWFRLKLNPFLERNFAPCGSRVGGLEKSHLSAPDGLVLMPFKICGCYSVHCSCFPTSAD